MTAKPKFEVDPTGLAKLLERRGKAFAVFELIQNSWDTNAQRVTVELTPTPGRPTAQLIVTDDDPDGFDDLSHAFTLFAESGKRRDPTRRGWINIGEKLVLALCTKAEIATTKGTVMFNGSTRHEYPRRKTHRGTIFSAEIKMTRAEYEEVIPQLHLIRPPSDKETTINGEQLLSAPFIAQFSAPLVTHVADLEGIMRRRTRTCLVEVFYPKGTGPALLYEMGLPVVETGDTWSVNVLQKVPLNTDRDNVPPGYLRTLRALVANHMRGHLTPEIAAEPWVTEALEDDVIEDEAVTKVLDERFGKKRFTYDPSDPEANNRLVGEGYTPIYAGALSKGAWDNVKAAGASTPAGTLRPTKHQRFSPDGDPMHEIAPEKQTEAERSFVRFTTSASKALLGFDVDIRLVSDPKITVGACYGRRQVIFNKFRLGSKWFEDRNIEEWMDLLIHELAHEYESNHLTEVYYAACTQLGARAFTWALKLKGTAPV